MCLLSLISFKILDQELRRDFEDTESLEELYEEELKARSKPGEMLEVKLQECPELLKKGSCYAPAKISKLMNMLMKSTCFFMGRCLFISPNIMTEVWTEIL